MKPSGNGVSRRCEAHRRLERKILEMVANPGPYKTLRYMQGVYKRIPLNPYLLLFTVEGDVIEFLALAHHDKACER